MLIVLPRFLCESTKSFLNVALIPGQISRIPVAVFDYSSGKQQVQK